MDSPTTDLSPQDRLADDLLVGAPAIGAELGIETTAVYYIYKKGKLPIRKWGKYLIASRRTLRRAARALTS
jgi:hypothetical protein